MLYGAWVGTRINWEIMWPMVSSSSVLRLPEANGEMRLVFAIMSRGLEGHCSEVVNRPPDICGSIDQSDVAAVRSTCGNVQLLRLILLVSQLW
jgi:hypothetical protein